jgi:hypothetical protein
MAVEYKLIGAIGMAAGLSYMGGAYGDENWCPVVQQRTPFTTLCPQGILPWDMPHGHNDQRGPGPRRAELLPTASSTASITASSSSGINYWIPGSSTITLS